MFIPRGEPIILLYRFKVFLSVVVVGYTLFRHPGSLLSCSLWPIQVARLLIRLPWILPNSEKSEIIYKPLSPIGSLLTHFFLLARFNEVKDDSCPRTLSNFSFSELCIFLAIVSLYFLATFIHAVYCDIYLPFVKRMVLRKSSLEYHQDIHVLIKQTDHLCSICYDDFVDGDEILRLKCGHCDHLVCLKPWIERHNSCPRCRRCIL